MLQDVMNSKKQEFTQLAEQYEKKWAPLLGESLQGYERSVTSILLENQLEYIEKNRGMLQEATVSGDISGPEVCGIEQLGRSEDAVFVFKCAETGTGLMERLAVRIRRNIKVLPAHARGRRRDSKPVCPLL